MEGTRTINFSYSEQTPKKSLKSYLRTLKESTAEIEQILGVDRW